VEEVNCDLCGADAPFPIFTRQDRFTAQKFQFVKCSNCGLIYLHSQPTQDELANYYPSDYEAFYLIDENTSGRNQWHLQRALRLQLNFIENNISSKGRLLDIGCATGNFLNIAHTNGWKVLGIEPIEEAAKIAREHYHLDVITGTLDSVDLENASFDVISMWDVLEHLPSPKNTLFKCEKLLKSGGLLVFSIPNLISFDRYIFGENWIGWDAPRHFNLFTQDSISQLLNLAGFEEVDRKCILGGKGTFFLSLDQVLGDGRARSVIKPTYPFLSALLWPYRQISYKLNRGPIISYAFRKRDGK
jgi:2-polyprenyl-3-methyl-5-hydroxy-6-metoxy-1,4-benzoquinol methylase